MRRTLVGALCFLLAAVVASGGPIKGLVDAGTGLEVPNADARYLMVTTTNVQATFSNLYVIGVASGANPNQVVNWRSMTNYVMTRGFLTTNSSPAMKKGTTWVFAKASVTNRASSGNQVVNWLVLTNYVTGRGYLTNEPLWEANSNLYATLNDLELPSAYPTWPRSTIYSVMTGPGPTEKLYDIAKLPNSVVERSCQTPSWRCTVSSMTGR
jgi:hypothetical protein